MGVYLWDRSYHEYSGSQNGVAWGRLGIDPPFVVPIYVSETIHRTLLRTCERRRKVAWLWLQAPVSVRDDLQTFQIQHEHLK